MTPTTPAPSVTTFEKRTINPGIIEQCRQLFFRQSMLNDYLKCPQMMLYRWVLNLEQQAPWLSAALGTAGHHVLYKIHESRKYDYQFTELLELFDAGFRAEISKPDAMPQIPVAYNTIEEAFAAKAPEYLRLLLGYQYHPRNQAFHSTIHEQSFVLEVPSNEPGFPPYLFTGQIDQGGYYDDGMFAVRDTKFRDNNLRPTKIQLDLDIQFTIYAAALRYGMPACADCRPKYQFDEFQQAFQLQYNGPCETCKAKIGTPRWPQKFVNLCEMVWMRDFDVYEKNQFEEWVPDNTKPKIPNPKGKGPPIYPRKRNPDFDRGYKKGQYTGVGFMQTVRAPSSLGVLMSDVLRVADEVRKGTFYRRPGDACNFLCRFRESCVKGLELEIQETNLANVSAVGTEDPW